MCHTRNNLKSAKVAYGTDTAYFLSVEYIIVTPKLADAEGLMKAAVLVCLGEEPRRVHEIFAWAILINIINSNWINNAHPGNTLRSPCSRERHPLRRHRQ